LRFLQVAPSSPLAPVKTRRPTEVHYARALHQQTAYRDCPIAGNGLPVCEALVRQVISLPMHAYLAPGVQDRIVDAVRRALR
jgi:dTDP-4-amino-4,6-dideoxygalactose transaminase